MSPHCHLFAWLIGVCVFLSFTACRSVSHPHSILEQISVSYADRLTQEEGATSLFSKYLTTHSSWQVPRADRLSAYEIGEIEIQENLSTGVLFRVIYSVSPTANQTNWAARSTAMPVWEQVRKGMNGLRSIRFAHLLHQSYL